MVGVFDGTLASPERLSIARIERLASALRAGWEDLLPDTLRTSGCDTLNGQWAALEPVIHEALNPQNQDTAPAPPKLPAAPSNSLAVYKSGANSPAPAGSSSFRDPRPKSRA